MLRFLVTAALAAHLAGAQSTLLVLQKASSSLGFYTPDGALVATAAVGRHPHEMVLSPDGRYLYTTDNGTMRIEQAGTGGNSVSIVDVRARKTIGSIPLGEFRRPHGIDMDPKTGRLRVTTELPDQLLVIDPAGRKILRSYDTKGKTSHMVTLSRDGRTAFVSNAGSSNVAAITLDSGAVKLITTAARPEGSVLSADGKLLYVANREGQAVTVIDTAKQEAAGRIDAGRGPVRIARTPDGRLLVWALMHDRAVEFADTATRKVVGRVTLGEEPVSMSVSPDGRLAYASAQDSDIVYVVSIPERKVVREIRTAKGMGPDPVMALE